MVGTSKKRGAGSPKCPLQIPDAMSPMGVSPLDIQEVTPVKSTIQRRFALLVGGALLAMAFVAPSAMATTVVKDPATGQLCPEVSPPLNPQTEQEKATALFAPPAYVSGGCTVHLTTKAGTALPIVKLSPTWQEPCVSVSYDIHVGPNGWGYVNNFKFSGCYFQSAFTTWKPSYSLAPGDFNPAGVFPASNAETDFNTIWGIRKGEGGVTAYVSLNATQSSPLVMTNQSTAALSGGTWQGSSGLLITH